MSTGRSETTDGDEKEQAEMLIRAMTEKNVKKIEVSDCIITVLTSCLK